MDPHEDPKVAGQIRDALSSLELAPPMEPFTTEEIAAVRDEILAKADAPLQRRPAVRSPLIRRPAFVLGGTMAAVACAAILGWYWSRTNVDASHTPGQHYATQTAEQRTITLNDGTRVTLAPSTTIDVPSDFGAHTRTLSLTGEALFVVPSAAHVPFIVSTGHISTQVLGTTFSIRRYANEAAVQVAVRSGKVLTRGGRSPIAIVEGQAARISDSTVVAGTIGELGQYTDWERGRLVFNRAPVPTILDAVGRWYGYQFRISDSALSTTRLTVTLDVTDREKTLSEIKAFLSAEMSFMGDTIVLTPHLRSSTRQAPARNNVYLPTLEKGR